MTAPFVPLLFQGEEWGATTPFLFFTDHERELGRLVSEGRRREFAAFGWPAAAVPDPQAEETFLRSRLDWSEPGQPAHAALLDWHRALIRVRRASPDLADGRLERVAVAFDEQARWLRVDRGAVTVAANLGDEERHVPLPAGRPRRCLLAWPGAPVVAEAAVALPPDGMAILGP
jgi:maltooligosyltrehalose trehalohydrolase